MYYDGDRRTRCVRALDNSEKMRVRRPFVGTKYECMIQTRIRCRRDGFERSIAERLKRDRVERHLHET